MAPVYSHSRLSSFENCRKQFQFRYVLKIPQETEGIEAFVGKRVHEILERLYQFVDRGQVPSIDKVVARYYALFDEHYDAERVRIVREGTPLVFYRELGERCLRNYYGRHYPFDHDETLGLEQRVTFALDPERRYRMQGIIDRIVRAPDGAIEVHDYKTSARVPSQRILDSDRQLALYQIGLRDRYGDDAKFRLVWHYVAKGQLRTSTRDAQQLETLRKDTIELIDRVESEQEYAPTRIPLCSWCEFKPICPEWNDDAPHFEPPAKRRATPEKAADGEASEAARTQLDLL